MSTQQIVSDLLTGNSDASLDAAQSLVKSEARLIVFAIKNEIEYASEKNRAQAMRSFIRVGGDAAPLLVEILKRGNDLLKNLAAEALVQIGAPAVESVIACLEDRTLDNWSGTRREVAAMILGEIGDHRAVQPLMQVLYTRPYSQTKNAILGDWDASVCVVSINALARLGDPQAFNAIAQMSSDPKDSVRETAAQALLNWNNKTAAQNQLSVEAWIKLLEGSSQSVRLSAVRTLTKLQEPQAIPSMIRALKDSFLCGEILDGLDKMPIGVQSVDLLLSAAEENNKTSERYILTKLKQIGPAAADALIKASKGPNLTQRLLAARALAGIKDIRAIDLLLDMVETKGGNTNTIICFALTEIGAPAIQPLLKRLRPTDDRVGRLSASSLYEMGTAAIPLFIQALDSKQTGDYAGYRCAEMITSICNENNDALKGKWQTCVCKEHLESLRETILPKHINLRRILELGKRDHYNNQSELISKLVKAGAMQSGFSLLKQTISATNYYACPVCCRDRDYFSPVRQIILVLDDTAKNSMPEIRNDILYYPWSPLMSGFRFHHVEIRSIDYPYSTTIERFIHRVELERRSSNTSATSPISEKIYCGISQSCKLSAADQNRLQVYFNLQ